MVRATLTPTIVDAGYRINVIPSEATATVDTRLHADEDPARFLESELHRFVRFHWDVVRDLAGAR